MNSANIIPVLIPVVPHTTRPKHNGEINGVEYNFVTEGQMTDLKKSGSILEIREYSTLNGGTKYYFTPKFDIIDNNNYLLITTPHGARSIVKEYGRDLVHILSI